MHTAFIYPFFWWGTFGRHTSSSAICNNFLCGQCLNVQWLSWKMWASSFFFFWPHHTACRILVPQPGIEPVPPALEMQSLNHWTTREVPVQFFGLFVCLIYFFIYIVYFWLCWVFVSVRGLSLVAASGGHFSSRCAGLSLSWPLLLRSTGSRRTGSVVVAHGPSCSVACGIFPDQGSNPCPLH